MVDIGEGIHRIPLTLPGTVNCYVIEGDRGLTLIDCGANTPAGLNRLVRELRRLSGDGVALDRLICTHLHFDHMGATATLLSDHPAEFVMHHSTSSSLDRYNRLDLHGKDLVRIVLEHGAPAHKARSIRSVMQHHDFRGSALSPSIPVKDGDRIELGSGRYVEVIHTPGHDRTHICLLDSHTGSLFSGDHILPRITPFVPYDPDRDGLADFLGSPCDGSKISIRR